MMFPERVSLRVLFAVQGLRPYSEYRAAGQQLLLSLKKGELSQQDVYWAHAPLSKEERTDILLITDK